MATLVELDGTARLTFVTRKNNGNPIDVKVTSPVNPLVTNVWLNGEETALIVPVIKQLVSGGSPGTPVTGTYELSFTTTYTDAAPGDKIAVYVEAVIKNKAKTILFDFIVDPAQAGEPFISVN